MSDWDWDKRIDEVKKERYQTDELWRLQDLVTKASSKARKIKGHIDNLTPRHFQATRIDGAGGDQIAGEIAEKMRDLNERYAEANRLRQLADANLSAFLVTRGLDPCDKTDGHDTIEHGDGHRCTKCGQEMGYPVHPGDPNCKHDWSYGSRHRRCSICGKSEYHYSDSFESDACFIATAAYGTPFDARIDVLRSYRDLHLPVRITEFYYAHSPPVADFIRSRDSLRALVRFVLTPLVTLVGRLVD